MQPTALLVTAASMRIASFSHTTDAAATSRRLSTSSNQPSPVATRRRFSGIEMVEESDVMEGFSTGRSSENLSLRAVPYEYLPWPTVEHPSFFSSSVQVPGFRARLVGRVEVESDEHFCRRTLLEYRVSSARVPLGANVHLHRPVRSLLSTHPQLFNGIKNLVYRWNQELLDAAATQLREELPSTRDPDPTTISSAEPPGFELREGVQNPAIAIAQARGRRSCQEDVCANGHFEFQGNRVPYVALFDGHGGSLRGGSHASSFCARELMHFILQRLLVETADIDPAHTLPLIWDALTLFSVDLSRSYRHHDNHARPGVGGSTVNAAFMIGSRLWVANVGDSRAMLVNCRTGEQIALSVDARPNNPRFRREAEERGGTVSEDGTRIGTSAVARAIGDHDILGVSARADVCFVDCPQEGWEDWVLVQTCDGIHEEKVHSRFSKTVALSSQDLGNLVSARIRAGKSLPEIANEIVEIAHRRGSEDNLSVVVTPLKLL
jgi:serine/threonine protein phosphatase PrpC